MEKITKKVKGMIKYMIHEPLGIVVVKDVNELDVKVINDLADFKYHGGYDLIHEGQKCSIGHYSFRDFKWREEFDRFCQHWGL